jgi:hypothetical protein
MQVRRVHRRDLRSSGASGCEDSRNEALAITVIGAEAETASTACASIEEAWVFFVSDKLNTAAMTQPTTMAVPHSPAAMTADRREVITRRLLYRPLEPCSRKNA